MDFLRGITVLGVSGSWRHRTPAKESLGLGSRQIVPAARLRSGPPARGGGMETGVQARLISCVRRRVNICALRLAAALSCRRSVSIFSIVCWLEPEVGVAPGHTGLLRRAAARFPPAGVPHSHVVL